jgi:hypothetical protein
VAALGPGAPESTIDTDAGDSPTRAATSSSRGRRRADRSTLDTSMDATHSTV